MSPARIIAAAAKKMEEVVRSSVVLEKENGAGKDYNIPQRDDLDYK